MASQSTAYSGPITSGCIIVTIRSIPPQLLQTLLAGYVLLINFGCLLAFKKEDTMRSLLYPLYDNIWDIVVCIHTQEPGYNCYEIPMVVSANVMQAITRASTEWLPSQMSDTVDCDLVIKRSDNKLSDKHRTLLSTNAAALRVLERKVLCKISGLGRVGDDFRIRLSSELYDLLNDIDVVQRINMQRLRWLGHVVPIQEDTPASRAFDAESCGSRQRGRPYIRWKPEVVRMEEDAPAKNPNRGCPVID